MVHNPASNAVLPMTPIAHDITSTGCLAHAIFSQSTLILNKFTIMDS